MSSGVRKPDRARPPRPKGAAIFLAVAGMIFVPAPPGFAQETGAWVATTTGCEVWNSDPGPDDVPNWIGECVEGKVHGPGTLIWTHKSNGSVIARFDGWYDKGLRTGVGYLVDENGNWFRGPFVNGVAHGAGECYYALFGVHRNCQFTNGELTDY